MNACPQVPALLCLLSHFLTAYWLVGLLLLWHRETAIPGRFNRGNLFRQAHKATAYISNIQIKQLLTAALANNTATYQTCFQDFADGALAISAHVEFRVSSNPFNTKQQWSANRTKASLYANFLADSLTDIAKWFFRLNVRGPAVCVLDF